MTQYRNDLGDRRYSGYHSRRPTHAIQSGTLGEGWSTFYRWLLDWEVGVAARVAVLWDLDGTLADTEQAHFTAWRALCLEQGSDLTWEQFKPTFGLGNSDVLQMLLGATLNA